MAVFDLFRRAPRKLPPPGAADTSKDVSAAPFNRRQSGRVAAREGLRILIIEDSAETVALLGAMLRQNLYETADAGDAGSGIAFARVERPELIFLDVVLPDMSGFDALRALRKDEATRAIPIVMGSGNAHASEQLHARRIGADGLLKKPFARGDVFGCIRQLVEAGRLSPRMQHAQRWDPAEGNDTDAG